MSPSVIEREPRTETIAGAVANWNYRDRFTIAVTPGRYGTVDQIVADWFTRQPLWLQILSTNSMSKAGLRRAIKRDGFSVGSAVGSWRVIHRNGQEIVFGDSMGFMEYWFSFMRPLDEPDTVEVSTAVRYLWPRSGAFYFRLVRPMHRKFVRFASVKSFVKTGVASLPRTL